MEILYRGIKIIHRDGISSLLKNGVCYLVLRIRNPLIERWPILLTWWYSVLRSIAPHHYSDADPLKLIYVDADSIESQSALRERGLVWWLNRGRVIDGAWDLKAKSLARRGSFQNVQAYTQDSHPEDDHHRSHDELSKLEENLVSVGYRSQRELLNENPTFAHSSNNEFIATILNEVTVDIGRNGQILWRSYGQHRLAMAKALGIGEIPVLVANRHRQWQEVRERILDGDTPEDIDLDHPDLRDITSQHSV